MYIGIIILTTTTSIYSIVSTILGNWYNMFTVLKFES